MDQDDTQSNKPLDAAAAAKRKRRSSILKSQRPPRTPFSELEFNVATPTDTTKSRRVSFSKRTGVAEFVTNEATTTWKNFYEEHNKSLETSGNDAPNSQRPQSIGQLGRHIFDQQFEEVEAIDFGGTILPSQTYAQQLQNSLNNVNITQQLAALECTGDKLLIPQQNFELSELTDQKSKLFNDELTIPAMAEMSNQMNVDFSAMHSKCDDLDEIQKDLNRVHQNVVGPVNFGNVSEYIEVDLNMTSVGLRNDDDMSITETVHSPKVQEVAKCASKKSITNFNLDDKENIALNPYAPICESDNFAIEEKNEVLVFDGKKLTVQIEKKSICAPVIVESRPRKTIILNTDDDLPNFISDPIQTIKLQEVDKENLDVPSQSTTFFDDNISMTQALPANVIEERRRTIIYNNDCNMSTTQAIPTKIYNQDQKEAQNNPERRRTIVYDNDCDISMTQALSSNVIMDAYSAPVKEKRQTIVFENDGDLSITQAVPTIDVMHSKENYLEPKEGKRKTIIFENDGDLSITQAVPTIEVVQSKENNLEAKVEKRKTIIFENDGDLSITQAIPTIEVMHSRENNLEAKVEKRKTIIFENDGDLSITQAVPTIEVVQSKENNLEAKVEKRKTIIFENDGDLSITQAIPTDIINKESVETKTDKRRTVVFDNDGDISITQALPTNIVNSLKSLANTDEERNDVNENDEISKRQAVSSQSLISNKFETTNKRRTIIYEDDGDISITQAVPANIYQRNDNIINTVSGDIPSTQTVNSQNKTVNYEDMDISITQAVPQNMFKRRTICMEADLSITQAIPSNILKNKTVLYDNDMDISITQTIPQSVFIAQIEKQMPNSNEVSTAQTQSLQILPRIESALLRECQTTIQNLQEKSTKIDISVTQSESNITDFKKVEINGLVLPDPTENVDTSSNVISQPTDLDMSVDDDTMAEKHIQNEFNNKCIIETVKSEYSNLSLDKPIPSNILALEEDKQRKSQNLCESLSGNHTLVYQTNVQNSEQEKTRSSELIEKPSKVSIKKSFISENKSVPELNQMEIPSDITKSLYKEIEENSDFERPKVSVTGSDVSKISTKTKKSILNELLDMSTVSEECVDKNIMAAIESRSDDIIVAQDSENKNIAEIRSSDVFKITRGSFDEPELEEFKAKAKEETPQIECEEDRDVDDLNNKLQTLKTASKNRHYEQVISEDMKEPDLNKTNTRKSFKNADDTRELLQMLSEFTDRPSLPPTIDEEEYLKEEKYGETQTEPRRITFAPNRRSIVLSKEELFNNISMAQAALQESHYIDETFDEATEMSNDTIDIEDRDPKSLRISSDVVKSLKFDDTDDDVISPLKKTAFGETTYMNESKEKYKVIPTYDVSDGIKELMNDLVKPMADVLPFEAGNLDRSTKKSPSTISTQIQANLITSSQIDIDVELHSNPESVADMNSSLLSKVASLGSRAIASVFPGTKLDDEKPEKTEKPKSPRNRPSVPGQVLFFDPSNPLNNVLLSSRDYENVHTYNPLRSSETLNSERERSVQITDSNEDHKRVETQYNVNVSIASGDAGSQITKSNTSIKSKPLSIDRSVEMKLNMRETEINTEIAMKPNLELLDAHSSLTLVDDALAQSTFDVDIDTRTQSEDNVKSPVRVIYEMDEKGCLSEKLESDVTSNDEDVESDHPKKRSLSPCVPKTDLTPKPQSKIQKMSNSPLKKTRASPKKSITVQEIMTEFNITKTEQNTIVKQVSEAVDIEMRSVTSYVSTQSGKSEQEFTSDSSRVDFRSISEQSSKNLFECDSSTNVVAKIDMLPFMGSRDCEWEATSGDTWSFLLLRSRLRLTVKREHSYFNSSRTSVRADTPVIAVNVDVVHYDEKDPLIALCLRFAAQSMRYDCSRKCTTAGEVPAMLKRCVAVSKTAVQWLKAMRDAMLRLAFQVDRDGCLTLKVANIRLRSVWEVSMRIELTVDDAHEKAWPCAGSIGITTIVADVEVAVDSLNSLIKNVPHDWGHVPRTIWKLFKYLKNKPRDDEFYGISILNMVK